MKLGLHLSNFTYGVPTAEFAAKLDDILAAADEGGFDRVSVMDHYFQIANVGPAEHEMFEAYGILGYLAARTSKVKLGVLTTGITYRHPGFLAKHITGLDVLSGGRAWAGVGAAWYEREHLGLGIPFPPLKERFERLEETIEILKQMWSDNNGAYEGKHYQLAETLCSPQPIQQPHPPLLIAGSGEKKTLRLVAKHANFCNIAGDNPENVERRLGILANHCDNEGRDYDDIEKTIVTRFDPGPNGENASELVDRLGRFAAVGVQAALGSAINVEDPRVIEQMATKVIPQIADL
ncbi:MAG: LLM class F420-dependent oxidoreductase [Chloroflexi bacterium]|nr:LLM class F420-dependent oxidoreductase [Chloroflexota bacterium]MDA1145274.1 LLM class F420-dependent oxidoreductase [Chloroflexota bacterium]